jgi:hypothetical protein
MSKLKYVALLFAISIVGAMGYAACCAYNMYRVASVVMPNAYAADWTAQFVIEHLKANNNNWPKSWEDLRDEFDTLANPQHYAWSWEELQSRVTVDWDADSAILAAADRTADPPFHVIRLTDDSNCCFVNGEPNRQVYNYLQTTNLASQ